MIDSVHCGNGSSPVLIFALGYLAARKLGLAYGDEY